MKKDGRQATRTFRFLAWNNSFAFLVTDFQTVIVVAAGSGILGAPAQASALAHQDKQSARKYVAKSGGANTAASAGGIDTAAGGGTAAGASGSDESTDTSHSEMRPVIERYIFDKGGLNRHYPRPTSTASNDRMSRFYSEWLDNLKKLSFDGMGLDGRVDYVLLKNHLEYEVRQLDIQARQLAEIEPLLPFQKTITELDESRRRMEPVNSSNVA